MIPTHVGVGQLLGVLLVNGELLGGLSQGIVEALQLDVIVAGLECFFPEVAGDLTVDVDFVFVDEGLVLQQVGLGVKAIGREQALQLLFAVKLAVDIGIRVKGVEIVYLGVVLEAIDLAGHAALGRLAVHVDDFDAAFPKLRLFHQIADGGADGHFVVACTDGMGAAVGFALCTGGRDFYLVGEHGLLLGFGLQRGLQVEGDGKLAVLVGASFTESDLLVFDGRVPPPPAAPGEGGLTDHAVAVLHIVETEASQCIDTAAQGDVLVEFVLLLDAFEIDFEGGTFVLLHPDGGVAVVGIEVEHTIEPVVGDDERAAERAVFVSGEPS